MRIPHFLSIFLIPLFLIKIGWVSGQCLDDQSSLLLQLKNSLHQQNSSNSESKLNSWNPSTDCCVDWRGVKCDSSGRVTDLDLNRESIIGGINSSSSLFNLRFLKSLNLAYNNFNSAQIPPEFNNLASLTNLNLSNSYFGGQIPTELSQLTGLVILDLSTLFSVKLFLKLENPNLTMFVQNLTGLTELYLDGVNISAHGYDWGKAISSRLPNLKVLSLSNCNLSGPFDSSLADLQFLSIIRLDKNKLSSPVPEFVAHYKNLTSLRLSSCNLTGTFPQRIIEMQTLKILDLSINGLLYGSLPEFPQNGSMQNLLLPATNFSGPLPDSIGNLQMLTRVDLSKGSFTGYIPSSIANLTQLTCLDLSSNVFSGTVRSLQMPYSIIHIDLSRNNLSGQFHPTQFAGLVNLEYIDLRLNSFTGTIPLLLFSLPSLRNLQLSNNQFGGTLEQIPNATSSLLDTLDLSSNKLEGEIPSSFFDLKALNILSLSSNNLTGRLKLEHVRQLVNLTSLDLSHNNLSIETSGKNSSHLNSFPRLTTLKLASCNLQYFPDLKNQTRLFYLDLSDNQIFGEIPNWIWAGGGGGLTYLNLSCNRLEKIQEPYRIPSLNILDLHSNYLKGKMPMTPPSATYLDYSSNQFTSSIPFDIGNSLNYTIFFSVARNKLTGIIPESICNASYLQVLDMSDNLLNGTIPLCLSEKIEKLGILNLGKNRLSGKFLGRFQKSCGLETLDLNGNYLEGKMPKSLANCTSLEVLNIGNNRINDTFPCFLNNSTNLRVLVLRSNMFYGGIGCPGVKEIWQKLQIIDVASNNFSGLLPLNDSKWEAMMGEPTFNHLNFGFLQLSNLYYQDTVTVTNKGLEMELVKILTLFTAIDFSMNKFEGEIPEEIGELKSLYVLNLSHNSLSNSIPSSLGNLKQLESLDLSGNNLSGTIPVQLASLTFLAVLNLSGNQLTGQIPTGTQFQSFNESSFEGNEGLCGVPSRIRCGSSRTPLIPTQKSHKAPEFDWQFILTGLGFGVGSALVLAPIMFWKPGREWWDKETDKVATMILPAFGFKNIRFDNSKINADCTETEIDYNEAESENDGNDFEEKSIGGRYCVFCSKLNKSRKKVVHDPECRCHRTTPLHSDSSSPSSFSS